MNKNLSYEDCIKHYGEDPLIIKTTLAIMGMLPKDEQPIEMTDNKCPKCKIGVMKKTGDVTDIIEIWRCITCGRPEYREKGEEK
jgi:hypothetical protein